MATRNRKALLQMADRDPELAARLVLQALPGVAARVPGRLSYELNVRDFGSYRVAIEDGTARVVPIGDGSGVPDLDGDAAEDAVDFRLWTDAATFARLAAGRSPLPLALSGRLRIRGKRRRALKLRAMAAGEPDIAESVKQGVKVDPDAIFRSLTYMIDPEWTRGQRAVVAYDITDDPRGPWYVAIRDGEPVEVTTEPPEDGADVTTRLSADVFRELVGGTLTPTRALQQQLASLEGDVYPATQLGRWIERSQGRDEGEIEREQRQRELLHRRGGTWGAAWNGAGRGGAGVAGGAGGAPQVLPLHGLAEATAERDHGGPRGPGQLMSYGELYALWERQNWRAHELDFSRDREHWLTSPTEAQENTIWSLGSFYVGEERVTADLAPFVLAAPSGEVEVFLCTQLVDEARHAAFFDRFAAEVMALGSDDLRGRMREAQDTLGPAWHDVFDGGLRGIANRLKAEPDNLDLFVDGITTYHIVIEGVLAMTGQRFIIKYMEDHAIYPGFVKGFSLVERDEHRHIAFGVRFLKDMVKRDPHYGEIIEHRVAELVPRAMGVFMPPYADDPRSFVSYGYRSEHIYGYAYRNLKRRMAVIGLEVPPPEELMPGPLATPDEARAAGAPA
jgi:ribonucleoside-diphosphate reductase beta chain